MNISRFVSFIVLLLFISLQYFFSYSRPVCGFLLIEALVQYVDFTFCLWCVTVSKYPATIYNDWIAISLWLGLSRINIAPLFVYNLMWNLLQSLITHDPAPQTHYNTGISQNKYLFNFVELVLYWFMTLLNFCLLSKLFHIRKLLNFTISILRSSWYRKTQIHDLTINKTFWYINILRVLCDYLL